jgi:hypothetical protein
VTDYLTRCPNRGCELIYRPDLVRPFAPDKPPEEFCPKCGCDLEATAKRQKGVQG